MATEDVVLPLPKFGASVDHAFSERWIGHAGIDVFKLEVGDVGGSLVDLRATLDYRFTGDWCGDLAPERSSSAVARR